MNENQMPDWEKIALDLAEGIYQNGSWDNAQDLIDDRYGNDSDYLKPTPDALLAAVKKIKSMKSGTYMHSGHEVLCNVCARMKKIASSTLAAHKKAVT